MTDFPVELLSKNGIELTPEAAERFNVYGNYLLEENEKINLTAITDPEEVVVKHFLDCALFLKYVDLPAGAAVADIGSGAGFPSMVLKILRPDIELTMIDSLNKRIEFLKRLSDKLRLETEAIHFRAEDAGHQESLRESFDFVTARAVARMSVLSEYCLPLVKKGGMFVAMKGPAAEEELADSKNALGILCGEINDVFSYFLPSGDARSIITVKKISQTPPKYPRQHTKITKKPL